MLNIRWTVAPHDQLEVFDPADNHSTAPAKIRYIPPTSTEQ
jgi:hypothetical protein